MDIQLYVKFFMFFETVIATCHNENFLEQPTKKKCYFVSNTEATWAEARTECEDQGAILAKVEDEIDHQFIIQNIVLTRSYWIGMNDIATEGSYVWTDNTPVIWQDIWRSNQPNGGTSQNCIKYHRDQRWKDKQCSRHYYYLCEGPSRNHLLFKQVNSLADIAVMKNLRVVRKVYCMMSCLHTDGCRFVVVDMADTTNNCLLLKTEIGGVVSFETTPTLKFYLSQLD